MDHEGAGVRAGEVGGGGDGTAIDLHVTDAASAAGPGGQASAVGVAALNRAGVADGLPFLLGSDGSYDLQLNRFFRELDGWGVRAANSVLAYALDKWAAWSVYEGLIGDLPFRYVDRAVFTPQGMRQVRFNAESEQHPGPPPVKFVPFEDYLLWRDVGLRGRFPDGRPDPSWRGRHDERNALFADLLIYTGMRLGEASCLLLRSFRVRVRRRRDWARFMSAPRAATAWAGRRWRCAGRGGRGWAWPAAARCPTAGSARRRAAGCCWSPRTGRWRGRWRCGCRRAGSQWPRRPGSRCSPGRTPAASGSASACRCPRIRCVIPSQCTCSACCCGRRSPRSARTRHGPARTCR